MAGDRARETLADSLRQAICECGISYTELGRRAGVAPAQLSRFAAGQRDLTLQVAARIALLLGYGLVRVREPMAGPLPDPPESTRRRPKGGPPPTSAFRRGRGRRVDMEGEGGGR